MGAFYGCVLDDDGAPLCWGSDEMGQRPPDGTWFDLDAGYGFTCGVASDGSLACKGGGAEANHVVSTPAGAFSQVIAGESHYACALEESGAATCWGDDYDGETVPPFVRLGAGRVRATSTRVLASSATSTFRTSGT